MTALVNYNRVSWNNQPIVTIILEYTKTTD